MKILMPNHFPLQGSGSGIYTLNVATELVEAGHEVEVIVPDHRKVADATFPTRTILFRPDEGEPEDGALDFNFPCFTTHPRSVTTFYDLNDAQIAAYVDAWRHSIRETVEEFAPDVIHAHHVWITPYVSQETGIPYVVTCHGTDLMGFRKDARYRDMALTGARNAHGVIAISRQVQSDAMEAYGLTEDQTPLIWNGFGAEHFKVLPDTDRASVLSELQCTDSDGPIVSFVGKFTDFKGIDVLLRAAATYEKALPGVQTLLSGHGTLWEEMHALREKLGLSGVRFLGHQNQGMVARISNIADVAIVPSRIEPFGLVAIEALACGTPVVATNAGGLPDFINEEVGALVPVDDADALAEAIIDEISNKTKSTKGVYAAKYASEGFTWKRQVAKMVDLYKNAIAGV